MLKVPYPVYVGNITINKPTPVSFSVENVGSDPVIITQVKPSCGCITISFDKTTLQKGDFANIRLSITSKRGGDFSKKVHIHAKYAETGKEFTMTTKINGFVIA